MKELVELLCEENIKINEEMKKHITMKVGGKADYYIEISNFEKLKRAVEIIKRKNLTITVIGNGSNVIVKDTGISGVVIRYTSNNIKIEDDIVYVDSGVLNPVLANKLLENNLSGYEFAQGIPGTVGGGIYMNMGAYNGEIKDVIEEVTYFDLEEENIKTIKNQECKFSFRTSIFQNKKCVILNCKMKLKKEEKEIIKNRMLEFANKRKQTQPLNEYNSGSIFKRMENIIPAKLIDESGLKGYSIGGAKVSEKHSGFIVNTGNATATDIINLIEYIKKEINIRYKINLETEVRILGK